MMEIEYNAAMNVSKDKTISTKQALETLKLFRIIFKSANRHFHEIERNTGIGGASLWALAEIVEAADKLTVTDLAVLMSIHQSTASNLLDKLESKGYVSRFRCADDRRVVYLMPTDLGRDVLLNAPLPHRGILPDALQRLDPSVLSELYSHLVALVESMEKTQISTAFEPLGKH